MARNNAGKTSLISALHFLFYGCESEDELQNYFNTERKRVTGDNEEIETYVKAKIFSGSRTSTLTRMIKGYIRPGAKNKDTVKVLESHITEVRHGGISDETLKDESVIQGRLNEIIPKELFDFFFFKGEELSTRLIEKKDTKIRTGLAKIIFEEQISDAIGSIEKVIKQYENEIARKSETSEEYAALQKRLDILNTSQDSLMLQLQNKTSLLEDAEKTYQEYDKEFAKCERKVGQNEKAKEAIYQIEKRLGLLNDNLRQEDARCKELLGTKGWLFYISNALPAAKKVLNWMEKEVGIPPDYSEGLLSSIQKKEMCLCERPVLKGSKEWETIVRLRNKCLNAKLNNDLYKLMGRLDKLSQIGFVFQRNKYVENIEESSNKYYKLQETISDLEKGLENAIRQFDETADKQARDKLRRREDARGNKEALGREVEQIRLYLDQAKNDIEKLSQQLKKTRSHDAEIELLAEGKKIAWNMKNVLRRFGEEIKNNFYSNLRESVSCIYDEIVTDGSRAEIDIESLLPVIVRDNQQGLQQGGGQKQVLVIAYIIALAELRKKINNEFSGLFGLRELEDQCFFMDSVFAPMEDVYRGYTAAALPGKMKQLILLLSQEQWQGKVSKQMNNSADEAFMFLLHTNKREDLQDTQIDFKGKKIEMTKVIEKGRRAFSICKRLK